MRTLHSSATSTCSYVLFGRFTRLVILLPHRAWEDDAVSYAELAKHCLLLKVAPTVGDGIREVLINGGAEQLRQLLTTLGGLPDVSLVAAHTHGSLLDLTATVRNGNMTLRSRQRCFASCCSTCLRLLWLLFRFPNIQVERMKSALNLKDDLNRLIVFNRAEQLLLISALNSSSFAIFLMHTRLCFCFRTPGRRIEPE